MFRALALLGSFAALSALAQTGSLDFRVVSTGNAPVAGATVTLEGPDKQTSSGATEPDGHWRLSSLAPGVYRFTAFDAPGYVRSQKLFLSDLTIQAGQTRNFQFEVMPAPKLEGKISDQNGNPIAGATVTASMRELPVQDWSSVTTTTDANGFDSVQLRAVPASYFAPYNIMMRDGKVEATAPPEPGRFESRYSIGFSIHSSGTTEANLQLRLEAASIR